MARKMTELEKTLSKGEVRKLNALRRSVGDAIGEKAFAEWLAQERKRSGVGGPDKVATKIAAALQPLIEKNELHIPREGYLLKRGRRRVVVLPVAQAGNGTVAPARKTGPAAPSPAGKRARRGRRSKRTA